MSEFRNKSITANGMELLSKALSGERIEFTKIEMGGGNFTGDIGSAEGLIDVKQSLPITKITRKGTQVTLSAVLKIEDITSDYDWTEIGVYAKGSDGVEILYMYGHTQNSSFISKDSLNEKLINVTVLVSNVVEVTAVIDDSMVFLTLEALKDHNTNTDSHPDIKNKIKEVQTQIESVAETVGNINIDLTPVNIHTTNTVEEARNNINATVEACKNNSNGHTTSEVNKSIQFVESSRDNIKAHITTSKSEIISSMGTRIIVASNNAKVDHGVSNIAFQKGGDSYKTKQHAISNSTTNFFDQTDRVNVRVKIGGGTVRVTSSYEYTTNCGLTFAFYIYGTRNSISQGAVTTPDNINIVHLETLYTHHISTPFEPKETKLIPIPDVDKAISVAGANSNYPINKLFVAGYLQCSHTYYSIPDQTIPIQAVQILYDEVKK